MQCRATLAGDSTRNACLWISLQRRFLSTTNKIKAFTSQNTNHLLQAFQCLKWCLLANQDQGLINILPFVLNKQNIQNNLFCMIWCCSEPGKQFFWMLALEVLNLWSDSSPSLNIAPGSYRWFFIYKWLLLWSLDAIMQQGPHSCEKQPNELQMMVLFSQYSMQVLSCFLLFLFSISS